MLDMDRIRELGRTRRRALIRGELALTEAYDVVEEAYEAGDRVNVKQVAGLLGVTRQEVYRELERRKVRVAA